MFITEKELNEVKEKGWLFCDNRIDSDLLLELEKEHGSLKFDIQTFVETPVNQYTTREVTQSLERYHCYTDNPIIPVAKAICKDFRSQVVDWNDLEGWELNEIQYQTYRNEKDHISPHRDRKSDHKLSMTISIAGEATIRVYESLTDPIDYQHLRQIDEREAKPGTVMFLRALELGNGIPIIHEVLPPKVSPRKILNLRCRKERL